MAESFFGSLKTERVFFSQYKNRERPEETSLITLKCFTIAKGFILIWSVSAQRGVRKCGF